jgi:hypothetical protein
MRNYQYDLIALWLMHFLKYFNVGKNPAEPRIIEGEDGNQGKRS